MGLWNALFGKKEVKPFKPEKFPLNDRTLTITAKHGTMISIYDNPLSSVEGTVTELKQNKNEVTIKNLEGILFLSKDDFADLQITCEGTLQGDWYFPGTIEAKNVNITIRKPMKLNIYAQIVSAEGYTNVQNYYMPTDMLPDKFKEFNPAELTPEEINGSYEVIAEKTDALERTRIMAHTVRLSYMPIMSEDNNEEE
jgi:hypothetical protein